jgi:hypothetical protein
VHLSHSPIHHTAKGLLRICFPWTIPEAKRRPSPQRPEAER